MEIPFALAFTAGLVATVNPCGFAMLPAYLAFFVGLEQDGTTDWPQTVSRALRVGSVVSAGFVTVFVLAGVLVTFGVRAVTSVLPWAAMVVGVGIALLGVALLLGHELRVRLPALAPTRPTSGLRGLFVFGLSYAVASLSCTLPIFLVVVAGTIPQLGFVAGVVTFVIYGLGMSLLLVVVTLAVALGRRTFVARLRRWSRHINRVAGGILVLAGSYVVWFWATSLTGDGLQQSGVVVAVERASSIATNLLGDAAVSVAALLIVVIAVTSLVAWRGTRSSRGQDTTSQ